MDKRIQNHPMVKAFNPNKRHFLEAQWLPSSLNHLVAYGIKVAALTPFRSYVNLKMLPTWQMMIEDFMEGCYADKSILYVDSSGNTGWSAARLAPAFGFREVKVVMASDVPESKVAMILALGDYVGVLRPSRGKSVAQVAAEEGTRPGCHHLNQYAHLGNLRAHEIYTGPEVRRVLTGNVAAVAAALGSGGTVGGVGNYFKSEEVRRWLPDVKIIGVHPKLGEQVPGARDKKKMAEVSRFNLNGMDAVVEVSRKESFIAARQLWSAVEPQPGPTSGMAWRGLEQYLESLGSTELMEMRGKTVGFICHDDMRPYPGLFMAELDPDQGVL